MNRLRILLFPLSLLYGAGVFLRNWFFEIQILKVANVNVPVISVGNLSAGGVGKTPFVELLVSRLARAKRKIAIVSRGYGRRSKGYVVVSNGSQQCAEAWNSGDEPAQLAAKLERVVVVVDEKRTRAARNVIGNFDVNLILLDDGFQHRYLNRDLDIVLMTAEEITTNDYLLPAGDRREPLSSLRRADLVVVTRCGNVSDYEEARARLTAVTDKPTVGVRTQLKGLRRASSKKVCELSKLKGNKVLAFSGIGHPESFERILRDLKVKVTKHLEFTDHHWYTEEDIQRISREWRSTKSQAIVTTEKDVARLREHFASFLDELPVYYIEIKHIVIAGEKNLERALSNVLK